MWRMVLPLSMCLAIFGCAHKQKPEAKKEAPAWEPKSAANKADSRMTQSSDTPSGECASELRVHFALDSSDITESEKPLLERAATCLKDSRALHVIIEGNADERGTEEYNLALSDRRAQAVMKHLERLGASRDQLATVSYGKDNPLCTAHDEACWAQNRRAAIKPKDAPTSKKSGR